MRERRDRRRGITAVVMVVVLLIIDVIIVGMVLSGARHHELTVGRMDTIQAFYAAEAGANMAIRELQVGVDEDGDDALNPDPVPDGIGTISFDDPVVDDANDPTFGSAQVVVTAVIAGSTTTLTSEGRSGTARRTIEAVVESP